MRLDTLYTINTPEGIELQLAPAGPLPRMLAWIVDLLIRAAISIIVLLAFAILGRLGEGLALIFIFLLEWLYPVWFELRHYGQTPGKKMFNLYVTHTDASPITPAASMIRNLLRFVDFLPFLYGFALFSMLLTQRFQRLGDLAADTVVVHKRKITEPVQPTVTEALQPPFILALDEQQTLLQFAQRAQQLTPERAEELAIMSGALVASKPQDYASETLQAYGAWIAGVRKSSS